MAKPMDGVIESVAGGQHGLFTSRQARESGATEKVIRHRVRTGRWRQVHPGVFALLGAPLTPTAKAHAAVLAAGPDAVASHITAAGLIGIPGFTLDGMPIHVTTRSYTQRRRTPALVHGTLGLPPHHRRSIAGVPCTSVARTLFDLCGELPPRRAERALDNALARRLVTVPALWRVIDDVARRGRAGSKVLGRLLIPRGGRYAAPESELEARFIELTHSHGLAVPDRQIDVGDADSWIGRVDFAYRDAHLVIECDGALGHSSLLDRRSDDERNRRLRAAGWTVLRFTWADVTQQPAAVAQSIRAALDTSTPSRETWSTGEVA